MFLFKKRAPSDSHMETWLSKVDDAYVKASQCGNVQALVPFCTRACLTKIAEQIRLGGKEYAGLERYRHVKWSSVDDNSQLNWVKEVSYDHVNVSRGVIVPVGDDYHERWSLTLDAETRLVSDIRRLT